MPLEWGTHRHAASQNLSCAAVSPGTCRATRHQEELLQAVWLETAASDAVLKVCIGELRKLLHETIHEPQFITTVHRRGYRFIGKVKRIENSFAEHLTRTPSRRAFPEPAAPVLLPMCRLQMRQKAPWGFPCPPPPLVEREIVLRTLQERLGQAQQGRHQVVFVTGEAGIGKTAVVEAFAAQATASSPAYWPWTVHRTVRHWRSLPAHLRSARPTLSSSRRRLAYRTLAASGTHLAGPHALLTDGL